MNAVIKSWNPNAPKTFEQKVDAVANDMSARINEMFAVGRARQILAARRELEKQIREALNPPTFKKAPVVIGRNANKVNRMTYAEAEDFGLGHMDGDGFHWYANSSYDALKNPVKGTAK